MPEWAFSDHVDRFAIWAASRASSQKGYRFEVRDGVAIAGTSGLRAHLVDRAAWMLPQPEFDELHRTLRSSVIEASREHFSGKIVFSHGVAAKLINIYAKVWLIAQGEAVSSRAMHVHPPVDSTLMKSLSRHHEFGSGFRRLGATWTKFSSTEYESVIRAMRHALGPGVPLWCIEEFWPGFQ